MTASAYTPSEEFPTYADYRRAKQREARKAWKQRNAAAYAEAENARRRRKYADDQAYADKARERAASAYALAPEQGRARAVAYRVANLDACREKGRAYASANKSALAAYKLSWARANAARVNHRNSARRALCSQATPKWADKEAIDDVYVEARHMQMHVDHIVPLNHPLVCGLHVWDNLQLLTPMENMRKNNRFDPENYDAR